MQALPAPTLDSEHPQHFPWRTALSTTGEDGRPASPAWSEACASEPSRECRKLCMYKIARQRCNTGSARTLGTTTAQLSRMPGQEDWGQVLAVYCKDSEVERREAQGQPKTSTLCYGSGMSMSDGIYRHSSRVCMHVCLPAYRSVGQQVHRVRHRWFKYLQRMA